VQWTGGYAALNVPVWSVIVMFQPDLGSWLEVVAAIVFFKGLLELALIWRVFRQTHQRRLVAARETKSPGRYPI